jgi:hypothetical protein
VWRIADANANADAKGCRTRRLDVAQPLETAHSRKVIGES